MTKRKSPDFSDFLERLQQFVRRRGQKTVGAARACESGGTWRVWRDPQRATASSAIGNFAWQKAVNEWSQALSNLLFTVGHGSFYFKLLITSWCFGLPFFFFPVHHYEKRMVSAEGFESSAELSFVSCLLRNSSFFVRNSSLGSISEILWSTSRRLFGFCGKTVFPWRMAERLS